MKEQKKAILISLVFLIGFAYMPHTWHMVADAPFHFAKSAGECPEGYSDHDCGVYFPLLHIIGSLFSFSPKAFVLFLLFLTVFVTPLILFLITRKAITVWFYFATTNYFYAINGGGAYPQAFAVILMLLVILVKNPWIRAGILLVSIVAHSMAFFLVLAAWIIFALFEKSEEREWLKVWGHKILLGCSAFFGNQKPEILQQPINQPLLDQNINISIPNRSFDVFHQLKIIEVVNFFVRTFPFPFLLASFWQSWKEKEYAPIVFSIFAFLVAFWFVQARIFWVIPLVLLYPLTKFYYSLSGWKKTGFLVLTALSFVFQFGSWLLFKLNCI